VKDANLALRFLLELCLLAALAYVGLQANVALAIAAPLVAAIIWGLFVSPKARFPLARPPWVAVQVVLFGVAVGGLIATENAVLGGVFGAVVAVNLALVLIWHQDDTDTSHVPA
jgi:hypothetical protein